MEAKVFRMWVDRRGVTRKRDRLVWVRAPHPARPPRTGGRMGPLARGIRQDGVADRSPVAEKWSRPPTDRLSACGPLRVATRSPSGAFPFGS
jgi:hypothetical protein